MERRILPDGVQHRRNCLLQDIDNAVEERVAGHERRRQADAVQRDARVEPALEQRVRELLRETGRAGNSALVVLSATTSTAAISPRPRT